MAVSPTITRQVMSARLSSNTIVSRRRFRWCTGISWTVSGDRLGRYRQRRRCPWSAGLVAGGPAMFGEELVQGVAELVDAFGRVGAANADGDAGLGGVVGGGPAFSGGAGGGIGRAWPGWYGWCRPGLGAWPAAPPRWVCALVGRWARCPPRWCGWCGPRWRGGCGWRYGRYGAVAHGTTPPGKRRRCAARRARSLSAEARTPAAKGPGTPLTLHGSVSYGVLPEVCG